MKRIAPPRVVSRHPRRRTRHASRSARARGLGWTLFPLCLLAAPPLFAPGARASARTAGAFAASLDPAAARALEDLTARLGIAPATRRLPVPTPGPRPRWRVNWVGGFRLPVSGSGPAGQARAFLRRYGALLGIDGPVQLGAPRRLVGPGRDVVRFELSLAGRPILGAEVAVTVQRGVITSAAGGLPRLARIAPPLPRLTFRQALAAVQRLSGAPAYRVLGLGYWIQGEEARLVYRLDQYRVLPSGRPERLLLAVDAHRGDLVTAGPGLRAVQGWVYDPSPAGGQPYVARDLADLTAAATLTGIRARVFQCGPMTGGMEDLPCQGRFQAATPTDAAGNYFHPPAEPSTEESFAEVQAYYHVTEYARWLETRFGFLWSCNGPGPIDVHVNMAFPNAFYGDADGDPAACEDLTLGQGSIDYAYDAEVVYHEYTHGMNNKTARLGCPDVGLCLDDQGVNLMPNAIDEALADYFAMTRTGDPDIGEYAGQDTGAPYIRTARNSLRCPWDLTAESHDDGQIVMGGLWSLREQLGADKTDALTYAALQALPPDALLDTWAAVLGQAAADLVAAGQLTSADQAAVAQMLGPQDRALVGCDRFVPLDGRPPGQTESYVFALPSFPGIVDEWPLPMQFTLTAPANAQRLRVYFLSQYGGVTDFAVYLRADQPVYVQVQQGTPYVVADHAVFGAPFQVEVDALSDPPLQPGSTYYVTAVYRADDYDYLSVWGSVSTGPVGPPDAGVPDASGAPDASPAPDARPRPDSEPAHPDARPPGAAYAPDSFSPRAGCACRSTGSQPPPVGALLLLMGLLGLAARRRWSRCATSASRPPYAARSRNPQ